MAFPRFCSSDRSQRHKNLLPTLPRPLGWEGKGRGLNPSPVLTSWRRHCLQPIECVQWLTCCAVSASAELNINISLQTAKIGLLWIANNCCIIWQCFLLVLVLFSIVKDSNESNRRDLFLAYGNSTDPASWLVDACVACVACVALRWKPALTGAATTSWTLLKYKVMQSCLTQTHWPHAHQTIIQAGSAGSIARLEPYRISVVIATQQCFERFHDHENNLKIKNYQFYCRDSWCGLKPHENLTEFFYKNIQNH